MENAAMVASDADGGALVYNRVPRVTVDFWVIKLMAVTVGETAADFLAEKMGLGLSATSWVMAGILTLALFWQFSKKRYVPLVYWVTVVLVSIVGTLITDNLVDNMGIGLETTSIAFGAALIATFMIWFALERTLSIHTIYTTRRETFYWIAILLTFAFGTAAGDYVAEGMGLGYLEAGIAYGTLIAAVAIGYFVFNMNGVLSFWLAYILTRPMGASFGDLLSQPHENGGLGFGTTMTSALFLVVIALVIIYMSFSREGLESRREVKPLT